MPPRRLDGVKWPLLLERAAAVLLWLALWQAAAVWLDQPLLLASPWTAAGRLFALARDAAFYRTLAHSFARIALGFFLALLSGVLLAVLSLRLRAVRALLRPPMLCVKSVPVASFIILALIWFNARSLSLIITFLMVLPILYNGALGGMQSADARLLEVARVFRVPFGRRLRYIHLPAAKSQLLSASATALGMAWKAGVAAEVIGIPGGTIGERLYMAKVYLDTGDLFAWTAVIVCVSAAFEGAVSRLLRLAYRAWEGR